MGCKGQVLRIEPDGIAHALQHGALEVVRKNDPGNTAPGLKCQNVATQEAVHLGVQAEVQKNAPGIRQHHHECHQGALGFANHYIAHMGPVHLGLFTGESAQSQVRLGCRPGTQGRHQMAEMRTAATIATLLNHGVQATGRQGGELGQRLLNERHEGINQAGRHGGSGTQHTGDGQDTSHGVAVKMQLAGNGADSPLVGQIQTQDVGAQFRGNNHYAPTCCSEESLDAPALDWVIGTSGSATAVQAC